MTANSERDNPRRKSESNVLITSELDGAKHTESDTDLREETLSN
jgi:hypothetical protein